MRHSRLSGCISSGTTPTGISLVVPTKVGLARALEVAQMEVGSRRVVVGRSSNRRPCGGCMVRRVLGRCRGPSCRRERQV